LPAFLNGAPVREKEASFCLLDQRSTECAWETVRMIANHKGVSGGNKIELFYFLPQGWIDRAIKSWRVDIEGKCRKWWGRDGVMEFLKLNSFNRGLTMARRFRDELGYKHSYPFPIQKEGEKGCIMFWMIHASDHDRATTLMTQAYRFIGAGGGLNDPVPQLELL
jgi:three-Cys-motif partner protein